MDGMDIVKELASKGYIVEPDALEALKGFDAGMLDRLISGLDPSAFSISKDDVAGPASRKRPPVKILSDITNNSTCIGNYDEFVGYFRDRYGRLGDMMRHRLSARPIESLKKKNAARDKAELSIIGMVADIRDTANGNRLVELEDRTGSIGVLITGDKDIFNMPLLLDEVVGVTGTVREGLMRASSIVYPDVPNTNEPRRSSQPSMAALISDVHVGSDNFLEGPFLRFIDWLNGDYNDDGSHDLVSRIQYVVMAGDLVDGIGVYPGQEKELKIKDVYEQYEKAAGYFDMFPPRVKIIITPGNHDAVRQAEPQPALPDEIKRMFRHPDVTFAGSPSAVEIEGVRLLVYHGRSLDDLVSSLPGASYSRPEKAMVELLKRRHLSPVYGGKVLIAPEAKDHFVIDPLPDIIHSGHVHTVGVCRYRGVTLVNSGAWQSQTEYQKRMNIRPDPAKVPIMDLHTGDVKIIDFRS